MSESLPEASTLTHDLAIKSVRSTIVDVPTVRQHKLSQTSVSAQSYVVVQVRLANGAEGIGEAATLGGPRWSEESVEAMKANIDAYLAPAIIGTQADRFELAGLRLDQAAKRNNAAKAAIETALFDAVGKTFGLPAAALPEPTRRRIRMRSASLRPAHCTCPERRLARAKPRESGQDNPQMPNLLSLIVILPPPSRHRPWRGAAAVL